MPELKTTGNKSNGSRGRRRRRRREWRRKSKKKKKKNGARGREKHASSPVSVGALAFVSSAFRPITFIKLDLKLHPWTGRPLKPPLSLFLVCAVNAGCGAKDKALLRDIKT